MVFFWDPFVHQGLKQNIHLGEMFCDGLSTKRWQLPKMEDQLWCKHLSKNKLMGRKHVNKFCSDSEGEGWKKLLQYEQKFLLGLKFESSSGRCLLSVYSFGKQIQKYQNDPLTPVTPDCSMSQCRQTVRLFSVQPTVKHTHLSPVEL